MVGKPHQVETMVDQTVLLVSLNASNQSVPKYNSRLNGTLINKMSVYFGIEWYTS